MGAELSAHCERRYERGPTIRADLDLPLQGITALFGRSGCGKTTVLRCLAGLERPQHGFVRFGQENWSDVERGAFVAPQERRIGFVSQEPALFPHLSVEANVAFGLRRMEAGDRRAALGGVMELLELGGLAARRPRELSGGQKQRVALARALAPRPRLVLLDEPLSALDVPARGALRSELRRVLAGVPAIVVTHDRSDVLAIADRIAVMAEGRVRQVGSVQEVFGQPTDPEVAAIVGVETVIEGVVVSTTDALSAVRIGPAEVVALNPGRITGAVLVCIRGEDVVLRPEEPGRESARNRLAARVVSVSPEGPLTRVGLDCGFALTALVTRPSCEELGIREGARLTALVKAPSVHLIQR